MGLISTMVNSPVYTPARAISRPSFSIRLLIKAGYIAILQAHPDFIIQRTVSSGFRLYFLMYSTYSWATAFTGIHWPVFIFILEEISCADSSNTPASIPTFFKFAATRGITSESQFGRRTVFPFKDFSILGSTGSFLILSVTEFADLE